MDFQQAERRFKQLKEQFEAGTLNETEFKAQLEELMVQDEGGAWWMIGYETERWYRHNGKDWVQTDPPFLSTNEILETRKTRIASGLCPKCGAQVKPTDKNCPSCRVNLEFAISHLDQW